MFQPAAAYRFRVDFKVDTGISKEYQSYLTRMVKAVKVNLVKQKLEIWFTVPEEGPLHEMIQWFTKNHISIIVNELSNRADADEPITRVLMFDRCLVTDGEIVYDYTDPNVLVSYTEWSYSSAEV